MMEHTANSGVVVTTCARGHKRIVAQSLRQSAAVLLQRQFSQAELVRVQPQGVCARSREDSAGVLKLPIVLVCDVWDKSTIRYRTRSPHPQPTGPGLLGPPAFNLQHLKAEGRPTLPLSPILFLFSLFVVSLLVCVVNKSWF